MLSTMAYNAADMLKEATLRHNIHLGVLVAETGLWANPKVHNFLSQDNGTGAFFPGVRRGHISRGEQRGQWMGNVCFDDNTAANIAIKRALGASRDQFVGFETCHIWRGTCYDERYHTAIANLVLLPRALAGLSDHDAEIEHVLQYRAYELYSGWYPEGHKPPVKPEFYPTSWREPFPFTPTIVKGLNKRNWRERTKIVMPAN